MKGECKTDMKESHILVIQILFTGGITLGSQSIDLNEKHKWLPIIARYTLYLLTTKATREASIILYNVVHRRSALNLDILEHVNRSLAVVYLAAAAILLSSNQSLFTEDFPWLFAAFLVVNYTNSGPMEMSQSLKSFKPMISYGTGMACSFYEGYFIHIMPSDGHKFSGFLGNIELFESKQGQVFPVKKLFLVIPKSLFCPPDLKEFNKPNRPDLPHLEALKSLEDVTKDVAAVKNRVYRNSVYKIYRPQVAGTRAGRPLCLAVECPTPLHTLYRVLQNRTLYQELVDVNVEEIVSDFCRTLASIVEQSPICRGKVVILHFDDTDDKLNLADALLDKIREIEPNFENILNRAETN